MSITARDKAELGLPINYITNGGAESTTQGWATYANSAANIPSTGTGGSPSSTWTSSTSSPLQANASFLWTKSGGANRQGEGVAYAFTINSADEAQVLSIQCSYTIVSGTFTASNGVTAPLNDGTTSTNAGNSDLEFFIYDVTNSILIPVTPEVLVGSSTNSFIFKAIFQTSSNSTSYRLIIHTATTTTNNFVVKFDNFFVGPKSVSYGPPVSDWTSYTPTVTGAGTVTVDGASWRRVGDSLELDVRITAGTVTGSNLQVSLPTGYSIDTTKFNDGSVNLLVGHGTAGSTTPVYWNVLINSGSSTTVFFSHSSLSTQAANVLLGNSEAFAFTAKIPITGWSSNVLMSNDTDTRVVAFNASNPSSSVTGSYSAVTTFGTKSFDTHGAFNASTGQYTIPVSGMYLFSASYRMSFSSASVSMGVAIYKNGVSFLAQEHITATTTLDSVQITTLISCVAGDVITSQVFNSGSSPAFTNASANCFFSGNRLSGPAAIAVVGTVAAQVVLTSNLSVSTNNPIKFDTILSDTHGAYSSSTGLYTVPVSGYYRVSMVGLLTSSSTGAILARNGSGVTFLASVSSTTFGAGSGTVKCVAGDTLGVNSQATQTWAGTSTPYETAMFIERVG